MDFAIFSRFLIIANTQKESCNFYRCTYHSGDNTMSHNKSCIRKFVWQKNSTLISHVEMLFFCEGVCVCVCWFIQPGLLHSYKTPHNHFKIKSLKHVLISLCSFWFFFVVVVSLTRGKSLLLSYLSFTLKLQLNYFEKGFSIINKVLCECVLFVN